MNYIDQKLADKQQNAFVGSVMFFSCLLLISNFAGDKLIEIFGFHIQAVTFIYPLNYVVSDIVTEIYGFKKSRFMLMLAFAFNLFFLFGLSLVVNMPASPLWHQQQELEATFESFSRISWASVIAYFSGVICNAFILDSMKAKFAGKFFAFRALSSSLVGSFIDLTIFCHLAFYSIVSEVIILEMVFVGTLTNIACETIFLPLSYFIINKSRSLSISK